MSGSNDNDDDLGRRLQVASDAARAGGALALDYFRRRDTLAVEHKGKQDLVSRADREVEELIRAELAAAFPGDPVLGEEGGGGDAERTWVIDPIDGTLNFLRGVPCWCVVIAYVAAGRTVVGVTYDPVHDELFAAARGRGATRNGDPICVSGATEPSQSVVGITFNYKQPAEAYVTMMGRLIERGFEHRRMGSTAVTLCYVSDGRCDALVTLDCSSWDVLAGLLTVEEAGGVASDYVRLHGLLGKGGVMASTPALAEVVEAVSGLAPG